MSIVKMSNKIIIICAFVFLLVIGIFIWSNYSPNIKETASLTGNAVLENEKFSSDEIKIIEQSKSSFSFEGYSIAKSHIGKFDNWNGKIFYKNGDIAGINAVIKADSVNTGIDALNKHLKSADFFETSLYPEIYFDSISIENSADGKFINGKLVFRGIAKDIRFPVKIESSKISANFLLDTTSFNMKYAGVNKEVRIEFLVSA